MRSESLQAVISLSEYLQLSGGRGDGQLLSTAKKYFSPFPKMYILSCFQISVLPETALGSIDFYHLYTLLFFSFPQHILNLYQAM